MSVAATCRTDKKVLIMATPKLKDTAKKVAQMNPNKVEYLDIELSHFSSLVPSTRLPVDVIKGRDVVLIADMRFDYMLQLLSLLCEIPRYGARTFTVYITMYLCATMERVHDGELGSAKTFARCISMTPAALLGPSQFLFFDPHAEASLFFFSDTIGVDYISAIPLLKTYLKQIYGNRKPLIAFPDEGAKKRFCTLITDQDADKVVFTKQRLGDQRVLTATEGIEFVAPSEKKEHEPPRPIVIVDDIAMSGGTLLVCADRLAELGASDISCFCVHPIFPEQSWKKLLPATRKAAGKVELKNFICTNTVPTTTEELIAADPNFFVVIDIAPVVSNSLGF